MIERRISNQIFIGSIPVGGQAPISVQSMTNTDTRDVRATTRQIADLQDVGCEIIRVAVPDMEAAEALPAIRKATAIPLIADIHFDHRLALASVKAGVDALRLNPGNIRNPEHISAVVNAAKERQIPIRIGINAGSLPPEAATRREQLPAAMVDAALKQVRLLEDMDFDLIKISLKAFDVPTTVEAYKLVSSQVRYPLHLGITEAGTPKVGSIRSAVGIGTLLYQGIGDTIRVSLTGDPRDEVSVGYEILKSLNLRERGVTMISCPTCGRTEIDLIGLANAVESHLQSITKPIKVAVMGCVVNGPGEAREADVGVAGGNGRGVIFKRGEIVRTVEESEILQALISEIDSL